MEEGPTVGKTEQRITERKTNLSIVADGREITLFQTVSFWSPTSWPLTVYERLCQHCHLSFENKSCNPPSPCNCHRSMSCGWTLWPTWVWVPRASTPTTWERSPAQKVRNQLSLMPLALFFFLWVFWQHCKGFMYRHWSYNEHDKHYKSLDYLGTAWPLTSGEKNFIFSYAFGFIFLPTVFLQHYKGCMYRHWS